MCVLPRDATAQRDESCQIQVDELEHPCQSEEYWTHLQPKHLRHLYRQLIGNQQDLETSTQYDQEFFCECVV